MEKNDNIGVALHKNDNVVESNSEEKIFTTINEVRFMIEDICPYSCEWCAVYGYKNEKNNGDKINLGDFGNNEGALVQNKDLVKSKYLTVEDYIFLSNIFNIYFSTNDVTLTGGEALYSKKYFEISKGISDLGIDITVLTKGAGLFGNGINKIEHTDRVIFSLDTLDDYEHFKLNLPLKDEKKALGFLKKTLDSIKNVLEMGKKVTINTVITPDDNNYKFQELINFCLSNNIDDLKFIELDSPNIKNSYVEKKFLNFLDVWVPGDDMIIEIDKNINNDKKHTFLKFKNLFGKDLKVGTYRLTCAHEHLFNLDKQKSDISHKKSCEIGENGSITINTTGEIIPCTASSTKKISLVESIKSKDVIGTINNIKLAINIIKQQKCPML